ncbi:MAG: hypothetical protein WEC00_03945 [Dongiaceae bacterium]
MTRRNFLRALFATLATLPALAVAACEKGEWDSSRGSFVFRSREGGGRN